MNGRSAPASARHPSARASGIVRNAVRCVATDTVSLANPSHPVPEVQAQMQNSPTAPRAGAPRVSQPG